MIKIAKKKLKKPKLKISSAERLNFKSNYFDYIFSIDAFHHFYNKEKAMKSFYRVLRFALAFWWLGPWALRFSTEWANLIVIIIGWIALIESFTGWCGLHTLFR